MLEALSAEAASPVGVPGAVAAPPEEVTDSVAERGETSGVGVLVSKAATL